MVTQTPNQMREENERLRGDIPSSFQNTVERSIGHAGNYYGGVYTKSENGQFYWAVENYSGMSWCPIGKDLFDALNKHADETDSGLWPL